MNEIKTGKRVFLLECKKQSAIVQIESMSFFTLNFTNYERFPYLIKLDFTQIFEKNKFRTCMNAIHVSSHNQFTQSKKIICHPCEKISQYYTNMNPRIIIFFILSLHNYRVSLPLLCLHVFQGINTKRPSIVEKIIREQRSQPPYPCLPTKN